MSLAVSPEGESSPDGGAPSKRVPPCCTVVAQRFATGSFWLLLHKACSAIFCAGAYIQYSSTVVFRRFAAGSFWLLLYGACSAIFCCCPPRGPCGSVCSRGVAAARLFRLRLLLLRFGRCSVPPPRRTRSFEQWTIIVSCRAAVQ